MALLSVYRHDNYGGDRWDFNSTSPYVGNDCNDQMTSFHLAQGYSVIFYVDADYRYELLRCPSADYPNVDCECVRPEHNDKMSSFRLYGDSFFNKQI